MPHPFGCQKVIARSLKWGFDQGDKISNGPFPNIDLVNWSFVPVLYVGTFYTGTK
jgi:hypothetical protein